MFNVGIFRLLPNMITDVGRFIEENHASKAADIKSQRDSLRSNNRGGPSQEMMQYWGMSSLLRTR